MLTWSQTAKASSSAPVTKIELEESKKVSSIHKILNKRQQAEKGPFQEHKASCVSIVSTRKT